MLKKIKNLIMAIIVATIFPIFRVNEPEASEGQASQPEGTPEKETPVKELQDRLATRDAELARAREKISGLEKSASEAIEQINRLDGSLKTALSGYKTLLIQSNPDILPELIAGETLEGLNGSLAKAKELTGKIRANLQEAAKNNRIPAGAPQRGSGDNSALSAREKIREGVRGK